MKTVHSYLYCDLKPCFTKVAKVYLNNYFNPSPEMLQLPGLYSKRTTVKTTINAKLSWQRGGMWNKHMYLKVTHPARLLTPSTLALTPTTAPCGPTLSFTQVMDKFYPGEKHKLEEERSAPTPPRRSPRGRSPRRRSRGGEAASVTTVVTRKRSRA